MAAKNPNAEDIYAPSLIDNFYPTRPRELENVCLYDFVAHYKYDGNDKNGERKYRKLTKPVLPNHKIFNPLKEEERESYYYSLMILFVPFRYEAGLILHGETVEEAFQRHRNDNDSLNMHHDKLQNLLGAEKKWKEIQDARKSIGLGEAEEAELKNRDDDEPQLLGEIMDAVNDIADMNNNVPNLSLDQRVAMLNSDQKRIYDKIKQHLTKQKQQEDLSSDNDVKIDDIQPLRMFISGVGGTGKSFLIETIKCFVDSLWKAKSGELSCAIVAPTGLAAFNVGGLTIHRLFQLPIEHEGKTAGYWSLPKDTQKKFQTTFRPLKIIIVDEVSMVSNLNLTYLHLRLDDIYGSNDWFGSKNIIFVGDLLQLPPVNGRPVFQNVSSTIVKQRLGSGCAINIWKETVEYDELTINERQKGDQEFFAMLDCIRRGCTTEETLATLRKRLIDVSVEEKFWELSKQGKSPVCLFAKRKSCEEVNKKMLAGLPSEKVELPCTDVADEGGSSIKFNKKAAEKLEKLNLDCSRTAGLEAVLTLAIGARVMLRRNIDVTMGLVNGAMGTVVGIYSTHVLIKFDHIDKPCQIEKITTKFMLMKNMYIHRKQYPLILAFAITIHKCQGLSLDTAIIDLSQEVFGDGMAYVALSRVRTLSGLHLITLDPGCIRANNPCIGEINRLRSKYRPDLPEIEETKKGSGKRKLTGCLDTDNEQPTKKIKLSVNDNKCDVSINKSLLPIVSGAAAKIIGPCPKRTKMDNIQIIDKPYNPPQDLVIDMNAIVADLLNNLLPTKIEDSSNIKSNVNKQPQDLVLQIDDDSSGSDVIDEGEDPPTQQNIPRRQEYVFYPPDELHQRRWCDVLNLRFVAPVAYGPGSPSTYLTVPNRTVNVPGDGNCLFSALSYIVTGSKRQHAQMRAVIVRNMPFFENELMRNVINRSVYRNLDHYLSVTRMYCDGAWGGDPEIQTLAALLNTTIYSYSETFHGWTRFGSYEMYGITSNPNVPGLFIKYVGDNHFQVVKSIA